MLNGTRGWFGSIGAVCGLMLAVFSAPVHADEVWVAPTYQQDFGGVGVASNTFWPVSAAGVVRLAWSVPNDLQTFQSAKVAIIPGAAAGASTLNVYVCAAQNHDLVSSGCAGP